MAYVATGTAGNDVLNQGTDTGPGTIVGLAGDDCIFREPAWRPSPGIRATTPFSCRPAIPER